MYWVCYLHFMLKRLIEYNDIYIYVKISIWQIVFQTKEQRELNVVMDTSGITKRQVVTVGISYATFCLIIYRIINKLLTFSHTI